LDENSKIDDTDRCCKEHVLLLDFQWIDEEDEGKGDGSSQTSVRHYEFVNPVQFM